MKYGIWEDGKRIEWVEPELADKISKGLFDYRPMFKKPESALALDCYKNNFNRPGNFDQRLANIKA